MNEQAKEKRELTLAEAIKAVVKAGDDMAAKGTTSSDVARWNAISRWNIAAGELERALESVQS